MAEVPAWKQTLADKGRKKKEEHDAAMAEEAKLLALWTVENLRSVAVSQFNTLLPLLEPDTESDGPHVRATSDPNVFDEWWSERGCKSGQKQITRAGVEESMCNMAIQLRRDANFNFMNDTAVTQGSATRVLRKKWYVTLCGRYI